MALIESPLFFRRAQVCRHIVGVPCAEFFGKTALFVSDIHLSWMFPQRCLTRLLAQMAALKPDLVLLGGDYAESRQEQERFFSLLTQRLQPPLGIFALAGNNDLECFDTRRDELRECMRRYGVRLLVNETACLAVNGGRLYLGGWDDWKHGQPQGRLFEEARAQDGCLLLSHHPRLAYTHMESCARTPDLMLCGHTHGGQMRFFGLTPYSLLGFEDEGLGHRNRLVSGMYRMGDVPVLVSNGIGTSSIPLRIGAPAQIHLLSFGRKA